jgi:hypothetical protein
MSTKANRLKCNNYGQYKLVRFSTVGIYMGLGLLLIGLLLSIFLVGIPIALMGLLVLMFGIISKSTGFLDKYSCNNCRKSQKETKATNRVLSDGADRLSNRPLQKRFL